MPRNARMVPESGVFHITARGNNKRRIFRRDCEFRYFKKLLLRYKKKFEFLLYHYALMKNHIHLSIKPNEKTDLARIMQGLQLSYGHYYRKNYGYVGYMWQSRFSSNIIASDEYLYAAALYIERNPVDAGIVSDPIDYPWSSYRYYAIGERDPLVDMSPFYTTMGSSSKSRQEEYTRLMLARIDELKSIEN